MNEVSPFRDLFGGLFFVSLGMLVDFQLVLDHAVLIGTLCLAVVLLKFFSVLIPTWLLGIETAVAAAAALSLAQVGEFSFLLARDGLQRNLLEQTEYQIFVTTSVILMGLTPFLVGAARNIGRIVGNSFPSRQVGSDILLEPALPITAPDIRVVIIGYGINGRNVSRALAHFSISHMIVELNPETVRKLQSEGRLAFFGDCTQADVLLRAGLTHCQVLVVAISDAASTRRCVALAKKLHPHVTIIARTRFVKEIAELQRLGADEVIPEEFETSVEIFARVLRRFDVPANKLQQMIIDIRRDAYGFFREGESVRLAASRNSIIPALGAELVTVEQSSLAVGKALGLLDLRARSGVTVVAVQRGNDLLQNPPPDFIFQAEDQVYLIGSADQVTSSLDVFSAGAVT